MRHLKKRPRCACPCPGDQDGGKGVWRCGVFQHHFLFCWFKFLIKIIQSLYSTLKQLYKSSYGKQPCALSPCPTPLASPEAMIWNLPTFISPRCYFNFRYYRVSTREHKELSSFSPTLTPAAFLPTCSQKAHHQPWPD